MQHQASPVDWTMRSFFRPCGPGGLHLGMFLMALFQSWGGSLLLVQGQTVTKDLLVKRLYGKSSSMCAILYDDSLKCWGTNVNGQLGYGDTTDRGGTSTSVGDSLPAVNLGTGLTVKSVCSPPASGSHRCAILNNGKVKCWGTNSFGQLGLGLATTVKLGDAAGEMGDALSFVSLGTNTSAPGSPEYTAKQVVCGVDFTCALLSNDMVKCWGRSLRLGLMLSTGNIGDAAGEMGNNLGFVDLGTGKTVKSINAGSDFVCAHLSDNTVKCWGGNSFGQLGLGVTTTNIGSTAGSMGNSLNPVDFGTGRTVKKISAGFQTSCVILDNDQVKCWGLSSEGTLGDGGLGDGSTGNSPSEMGDNLLPVNLGTGDVPVDILIGDLNACVRLQSNQVKCWGNCVNMGIGTCLDGVIGFDADTMGDALVAVNFGTGLTAKSMALGSGFICSVLNNNGVKCWGGQTAKGETLSGGSATDFSQGPATVPTAALGTIQCSAGSNSVPCRQCPTPTFWLASAASCSACAVGGYYVDPSTSCTTCPSGYQSVQVCCRHLLAV